MTVKDNQVKEQKREYIFQEKTLTRKDNLKL